MKYASLILTCLLGSTLLSCHSQKESPAAATEENLPENIVELRDDQIRLADIRLDTVSLRPMSAPLNANGWVTVSADRKATVCAPLGGYIQQCNLLPGQAVRKGQTLAMLSNPAFVDLQQQYLETVAKLETSSSEFQRQSELYRGEATSQRSLQQANGDLRVLRIQKNALEAKLRFIGITPSTLRSNTLRSSVPLKAPLSGYLKTVSVSIGQAVTPENVLFEIVSNDRLLLELTLFERDLGKVSVGNTVDFYINNESESHRATVYQVAKSLDEEKEYHVYATVNGSCKQVLPGVYVRAAIQTRARLTRAVPAEAVVRFEGTDYVFAFEKSKTESGRSFCEYRMIPVQKGVSQNGYVSIQLPKDVQPQSLKLVVKGAYNLLSAKKNAGEMAC
jgi:cobalt-zinc-cadmium efflux system membrane fusion protein